MLSYKHISAQARALTHTRTQAYKHTQKHTLARTHAYKQTRTHAHTHMHMHTYTLLHALACPGLLYLCVAVIPDLPQVQTFGLVTCVCMCVCVYVCHWPIHNLIAKMCLHVVLLQRKKLIFVLRTSRKTTHKQIQRSGVQSRFSRNASHTGVSDTRTRLI